MATRVQRYSRTTLSRPRRPSTPQHRLAKQDLTGTFSACRDCSCRLAVSHEKSTGTNVQIFKCNRVHSTNAGHGGSELIGVVLTERNSPHTLGI